MPILATYEPGAQKYRFDKFTNLEEVTKYFTLEYLEFGFIEIII